MENLTTTNEKNSLKSILNSESTKARFKEMLGNKTAGFLVSVLNVVQNNELLAKSDTNSVLFASATAASLDLPIDPNLGFAYIVPYKGKAQFQIGWRGLVQLAIRTGQFKSINAIKVYDGQLISENPLQGHVFDWSAKKSDNVIGYVSYFELLNGYSHQFYMTKKEAEFHGKKFSQTYKTGGGVWAKDFDSMALKTVLKLNLSKFAPLSIEMQKAVMVDQAVVNNFEGTEVDYVDNSQIMDAEIVSDEKEAERIKEWLNKATDLDTLQMLESRCESAELKALYDVKFKELTK